MMKDDFRKMNGGKRFMRVDSESKRHKNVIKIMGAIIVVLVLFIAFFFVVVPQMNKFSVKKQIEGANLAYLDILNKVQTQGYYSIPVGENQTLVLVPYVPQQQTSSVN